MKTALVVGLGISGKAAVAYLEKGGYAVTGYDDKQGGALPDVETFDLVVVSPGVPQTHPLYRADAIGEAELALRDYTGPAFGITGTNGKTTTTLLTAHILNVCGKPAKAVGNVGVPLCEALPQLNGDIAVVELSSYQLETMRTKVFDAAVCLNITEDHLDRYRTMENYAAAKANLANCCRAGAPFFASGQCSKYLSDFIKLEGIVPDCYRGDVNRAAAFALVSTIGVSEREIGAAMESFTRPPHRMEQLGRVDGINYINDSKGTNVDATRFAVQQLDGPIVLIAGGRDKQGSFQHWIDAFEGRVTHICAIGEAKQRLIDELGAHFSVIDCGTFEEAFERARELAHAGTVLLSPGCASFDMFRSYEGRGMKFKQLFNQLRESP